MKQNLLGRLAAAVVLLLSATTATAHDFEVDGIYYNKYDWNNTVSVTYKGNASNAYDNEYSGAVIIPSEVTHEGTTYSVTSIGMCAFSSCSGLTAVEIPNSVTSIDYEAFMGCSGLTAVEIPNSVTSIGESAFYGCSGLTAVEIPSSVTHIAGLAFSECSGLESITVESGNTKYDSRDNCNAIIETATNTLHTGCKNSYIPNSVISIGNSAFSFCRGLTSIEIPNSVTSIGNSAFYNCRDLSSIDIPNSVATISKSAFSDCSSLTSVVIPNSVTSIGGDAFSNCYNLRRVFFNATKSSNSDSYPIFDNYNWIFVIGENVKQLPNNLINTSARIVSHAAVPPVISANTFNVDYSTVYVSSTAYADYFFADVWKDMSLKEIDKPVASIAFNVEDTQIGTNGSAQLTATITPDDATLKDIYWSSDNTKVAKVDVNGKVQGLSDGEATIMAMAIDGSGVVATCHVTVGEIIAETLELDPAEITLSINKSAVITPIYTPAEISNTVFEWCSSNEGVARFKNNNDGSITVLGVAEGKATITCHTTDGSDLTATCDVTVSTGTGVENTKSTAAKVRGENGVIRIEGADGAAVEVFNAAGVCVFSGVATEIPVAQRGIYVVKVAGRATKIAL